MSEPKVTPELSPEPKLSNEEIQTKRKKLLDQAETICREISEMSPHLLEDDGEEFTQFVEYVKDLTDVFYGFNNYDVPAHVVSKHHTDFSQVVYKSGTHKVVCDVVTSRLTTRNYVTQAEDDTMMTSVSQMKILVGSLVDYSTSKDVKDYMTEDSGFLPALVHTLDAGHTPHLDNVLSDTQNLTLDNCMKILYNCTIVEKNIARVRDVGTVKVLLPYLKSHDGLFQLTSLTTLSRLVNEKEAESLLTDHVTIFELLIRRLDMAWLSSTLGEEWGFSVTGLIDTVRHLARNDVNKQVLVEVGCLPLLVEILDCQYIDIVSESLEALWVLSFDDVNKKKMVDEPNLVMSVWAKYSDNTSDDENIDDLPDDDSREDPSNDKYSGEIKKSSYGILWSLKDQLKLGKLEFAGIATKIELKKSQADMKPTQQSQQQTQETSSDGSYYKGHVMLSYQWGHKEIIRKICQELKNAGVPVWIDVDFMEGSTLETMAKAVEDCNIFVMAVSKGYKDSPNTRLEAGYAQNLNKPIIPLKMERDYKPDGWLGILMESKMFHDFSGKYNFEERMLDLLREIKNTLGHDTPAATTKALGPVQEPLNRQQFDRRTYTDQQTQTVRQTQTDQQTETERQTPSDQHTETDQETDRPREEKKGRRPVTVICSVT